MVDGIAVEAHHGTHELGEAGRADVEHVVPQQQRRAELGVGPRTRGHRQLELLLLDPAPRRVAAEDVGRAGVGVGLLRAHDDDAVVQRQSVPERGAGLDFVGPQRGFLPPLAALAAEDPRLPAHAVAARGADHRDVALERQPAADPVAVVRAGNGDLGGVAPGAGRSAPLVDVDAARGEAVHRALRDEQGIAVHGEPPAETGVHRRIRGCDARGLAPGAPGIGAVNIDEGRRVLVGCLGDEHVAAGDGRRAAELLGGRGRGPGGREAGKNGKDRQTGAIGCHRVLQG